VRSRHKEDYGRGSYVPGSWRQLAEGRSPVDGSGAAESERKDSTADQSADAAGAVDRTRS